MLGIQVPPRDPLAASQVGHSAGEQPGLSLPERVASELDAAAQAGVITLLTGPSGVGKSRVLRSLHARLRTRRQRVAIVHMLRPTPDRRPLACASSERLDRWLTQLARAGLADAALLPVRACDLSAGQHARLLVARAMLRLTPRAPATPATPATPAKAGPSPTLIIDEYASTLDVLTARLLTVSLSRWSRRAGVRVIVASVRDELAPALQRDLPRAHLRVVTLTHAGLAPMTQEARS
jgi:ABC-type transport system involved in cytochrome bd biosynthesis fused ATPase/permease subunit